MSPVSPQKPKVDAETRAAANRELTRLRARVAELEEALGGERGGLSAESLSADDEALANCRSAPLLVPETLDALEAMVVILDRQGRIVRLNRVAEQRAGCSSDAAVGKPLWELFNFVAGPDMVRSLFESFVTSERPTRRDNVWLAESAGPRCFDWSACAVRAADGEIAYIVTTAVDITKRKQVENALQDAERRLRRQNAVLVELATSPKLSGPFQELLAYLTETAAKTLDVARVNVWLYDADRSKIRCVEHFDAATGEHSRGQEIAAERYPIYFQAIEAERTIAADEAARDSRTSELADSYLAPAGIGSLLDAPIRTGGRMVGILCHEHVGEPRRWTLEDEHFAGSIADFVSLALAAADRQSAEQAVRDSEARLRHVLETMPVMLRAFDEDGNIIVWNRECEKVTGYRAEEILGNPRAAEMLYPDREYRERMLAQRRERGDYRDWEWSITCRDGSTRWLWRSNVSNSAQVPGWASWDISVDITSRKLVEDELRKAHDELEERVRERTAELSAANERLQAEVAERARMAEELRRQTHISQSVLASISDGVVVADSDGRFLVFNPAAERIMHARRADVDQPQWSRHFHLYLPDKITPYPVDDLPLVRANRGEVVDDCEIFVRPSDLPDGLWINVSARRLTEVDGAVAIFHDITERKRAIEAIEAEQAGMRQMLTAHENYRRLIACELHDGLVQEVTGALMHLEAIRQKQSPADPSVAAEYEICLKLLRDSIGEARRLISGLRPPIIDEQGLVASLEYLVSEQTVHGDIDIEFTCDVQFDHLESLLETTLFRTAQEALNNIRRHSRSRRATVRLNQVGDRVQLEVRDWGVGFDPHRVGEHRFGLQGIMERARILRGEARIESAPGEGTRILVDLPVAHSAHVKKPRSLV